MLGSHWEAAQEFQKHHDMQPERFLEKTIEIFKFGPTTFGFVRSRAEIRTCNVSSQASRV